MKIPQKNCFVTLIKQMPILLCGGHYTYNICDLQDYSLEWEMSESTFLWNHPNYKQLITLLSIRHIQLSCLSREYNDTYTYPIHINHGFQFEENLRDKLTFIRAIIQTKNNIMTSMWSRIWVWPALTTPTNSSSQSHGKVGESRHFVDPGPNFLKFRRRMAGHVTGLRSQWKRPFHLPFL
jgi:hypothetical protein